jgi:hypothetical protein
MMGFHRHTKCPETDQLCELRCRFGACAQRSAGAERGQTVKMSPATSTLEVSSAAPSSG